MTKQILILAYILTVLVISSLVRADDILQPHFEHGLVRSVTVNQETGIMDVNGVLSTPCQIRPTIVVSRIDQNNNQVTFDVVTMSRRDACIDVVYGSFDASFDLKELPLVDGKTYSIAFKNFKGQQPFVQYTAQKADQSFAPYRVNRENLKGTLIGDAPSGFALKTPDHKTVPMVSPDMDLNRYRGSQVWVSGYAVSTANLDTASGDTLAPSSQPETIVVPVSVSALER